MAYAFEAKSLARKNKLELRGASLLAYRPIALCKHVTAPVELSRSRLLWAHAHARQGRSDQDVTPHHRGQQHLPRPQRLPLGHPQPPA
eukprot:4523202-Pyramimonas_sp.AAC.2